MCEFAVRLQFVDFTKNVGIRRLCQVETLSLGAAATFSTYRACHERIKGTSKLTIQILNLSQWIEKSAVTVPLHTLAAVLIAFHSVFRLVGTFSLSIELPHTNQIEGVGQKLRLYL